MEGLRIGIVTSPTPSLAVVAKDLVYTFRRLGKVSDFYDYRIPYYEARDKFDRAIVVMTFDPLYAPTWFLLARDYNVNKIPSVVYTTVEGEPKRWLVKYWIRRDLIFIANSKFTEKMLNRVDIEPVGMIHHGVNFSEIEKAKTQAKKLKQKLKEELGVKVVFGTVVSGHRRKGLEYFAQAVRTFREKIKDAGFYVLTGREGANKLIGLDGVKVSTEFGKLMRDEILALIGSFDFYVQPSLCEGFGLPVLEAMGLGVPCIHPDYEPLTEFSSNSLNFTVKVVREEYQDLGDGILYLCHYYEPNEMAEKMEKAYELYICNRKAYLAKSSQVKRQAKKFDCVKKYEEFLKVWEG